MRNPFLLTRKHEKIYSPVMKSFDLVSRLKNDALPVGRPGLCPVRLIDDARWPWLVLIPMQNRLAEIHNPDQTKRAVLAGNNYGITGTAY